MTDVQHHHQPDGHSPRRVRDLGETLVEVVLTVVIMAVSVTALVSALASATASATSHRANVVGDTVMRNWAEAVKDAAATCTPGAAITPAYTAPQYYGVASDPASLVCPAVDETLLVQLTVTRPGGSEDHLDIKVRTP